MSSIIRIILLLSTIAAAATASTVIAVVHCAPGHPDYNLFTSPNYQECYTGSGPQMWNGNGPGTPIAQATARPDATFTLMENPDYPVAGARVVGADGPPFSHATAIVDGTFALTIELLQGGTEGYFLPCMIPTGDNAIATFAGVRVGVGPDANAPSADSCAFFPPMRALPFVSGVTQFVPGRFEAYENGAAYFYGVKIYDEDRNVLPHSPGFARIRVEFVPEPATLISLGFGLACLAGVAARRIERRAQTPQQ